MNVVHESYLTRASDSQEKMNIVRKLEAALAGKREVKRQALREKLIEAAWQQIARSGLAGLNARTLTTEVGCALGSIYTAFDDLDDIVMHANLRTLELLGGSLREAKEGRKGPEALKALASAYARFAIEHQNLWDALFDLRTSENTPVPDWFINAHTALLELISDALTEFPIETTRKDLETRSRTYFAAVHGLVSISLHGKFVGHPKDRLEDEIAAFVDFLARSLAAEAKELRQPS